MLYITHEASRKVCWLNSHAKKRAGVDLKVTGTTKFILVFAAIIGIFIVYKLLIGLVSAVLSLVLPVAVVLGIGYVIYIAIDRKALGGSRRYLP